MKKSLTTETRFKFATFDIETDPFEHGLVVKAFACDFFDGNTHHVFWGDDCLKKALPLLLKYDGVVYAHNGGKFDWHHVIGLLPFEKLAVSIINGRISSVKFNKCELRDSYLILPTKLKNIGGKLDIEINKLKKDVRDLHREEIIKYLKADCESLYVALERFFNEYGVKLTLAAVSFSEIKKTGIKIPKGNPRFDEMFRKFYYGGRVQVFRPGVIERPSLYYIDINSAYPNAMKFKHPYGFSYYKSRKEIPAKLETGFVEFIGTNTHKYGFLPYREKTGIRFPVGEKLHYCVTGREFMMALKHNAVKVDRVLSYYYFNETVDFIPFVEKFYNLRLGRKAEGDKQGDLFAKLILNSGYGKFATNPDRFKDYTLWEIGEKPDEDGWGIVEEYEDWGYALWEKSLEEKDKYYYNVATAASITGFVRSFLMESILAVKNPIYCDTDSIFCEDTGDLKLSPNLGDWKIEATGNKIWVGGKKIYVFRLDEKDDKVNFKYKYACKGAPLKPSQIIKMVETGKHILWQSDAPSYSLSHSTVKFVSRRIGPTFNDKQN